MSDEEAVLIALRNSGMAHVFACFHMGQNLVAELSRGGYWRKKGTNGVCMSFSQTVIDEAGGIRKLLTEWEQVP